MLTKSKLPLLGILLLLAVSACTLNPVRHAETVEQKAYALYGTFVIFEEQAAALIKNPSIPADFKKELKKADGVAKPMADSLLDATLGIAQVREELKRGDTTEAKLKIAIENLDRTIVRTEPAIRNLVQLVRSL